MFIHLPAQISEYITNFLYEITVYACFTYGSLNYNYLLQLLSGSLPQAANGVVQTF